MKELSKFRGLDPCNFLNGWRNARRPTLTVQISSNHFKNRTFKVTECLAAAIVALGFFATDLRAAPPNDNFTDRIVLMGTNIAVSGSTVDATLEPGEPGHFLNSFNSVWWSWTAPSNGRVTLSLDQAPLVAPDAFLGSSVESLVPVPNIDDVFPGYGRFVFEAITGTTYAIAVCARQYYPDVLFDLHLDLISNPPNDNFTNSAPITGLDATVTGSNIGATREAQEPAHAGQVAGNSVWWSWTAPVRGGVIISTDGSDFDTTVTAYRGTSLSDLQWINADDDSGEGTRSKIAFNAQEGVTYHLAVTGFGDGTNPSSEGNIVLHLRVDAPGAIPFTDLAETPDLKLWKEGNATAFAFQPDGKIIIAGAFSAVNGVARTNLVRLSADGSVDVSWQPVLDGYVKLMVVKGNDLFIAGPFRAIDGVQRHGLAKLSLIDGQVDSTWDPDPEGAGFSKSFSDSSFAIFYFSLVSAMAVIDDHLFVCGSFTSIGGLTRANLAKLDTAGTGRADEMWDPQPLPPTAESLFVFGDQLVVGGGFSRIGGQDRLGLAKLSSQGDGSADPVWNPNHLYGERIYAINAICGTNLVGKASCCSIRKVSLLGEGMMDPDWIFHIGENSTLAAGTDDSLYFASVAFSDIDDRPRLLKLNPNSSTDISDPVWKIPVLRRPPGINNVGLDTTPNKLVDMYALAARGDKVFIGGNFRFVNDTTTMGMAALDATNGNVDLSISAQVQVPGSALALARQPDGKIVIGGEFGFAADLPRHHLARLNVDGTVDPSWYPEANGAVNALAADPTGVYVAGVFRQIGGLNGNLARVPLDASNLADPTWNPQPEGDRPGISMPVLSLLAFDSKVYVGGTFVRIARQGIRGFSRIDASSGTADPGPFTEAEYQRQIWAMALQPDGMLVLAGDFATVAGIPRAGLARINANVASELDVQWSPPFDRATMGIPVALAVDAANVFVATPGGIQKYQIAAPGSPDSAWARPAAFSGISSLAVVDDHLYVGGLFRAIGFPTVPAGGPGKAILARLNKATGETQAIWNTPLQSENARIFTLLEGHGGVNVGGNFTRLGNFQRSGVAFLPNAPTIPPSSEPCQITCPDDIARHNDAGRCGANVSFAAPGTSGDCAGLTIDCVPPSGSFFPVGATTVTCAATDVRGGAASCSFTVTVTAGNKCPLGQGYWKNHPDAWPVNSLTLGNRTYGKAESLAIMHTKPVDARMILLHQLIAAALNTSNDSDPTPVCDAISQANNLLAGFGGIPPYHVSPSSATGQVMLGLAGTLDHYNNGLLTMGCSP